jgi:hypothetical protein
MQARRNLLVGQREHGFDQSGHARRGVQMPHVGLQRPNSAKAIPAAGGAKRLRQRFNFDRIAQGRARPVRFDVLMPREKLGLRLRGADYFRLSIDTRR